MFGFARKSGNALGLGLLSWGGRKHDTPKGSSKEGGYGEAVPPFESEDTAPKVCSPPTAPSNH